MKPYGRGKTIRTPHKKDVHPPKGWVNWWEEICEWVSRRTSKQRLKKQIYDNQDY